MFLVLGAIYFVLGTVGSSFVVDPQEDDDDEGHEADDKESFLKNNGEGEGGAGGTRGGNYGDDGNDSDGADELLDLEKEECFSTKEVAQNPQGWLLWISFILSGCGGVFVIGCYKTYGNDQSWADDEFLSLVGSLISVLNFSGRAVQGWAADKFGFKIVLRIMTIVQAVFLLTFTTSGAHKSTFVIWCGVVAFCYGGNFSLYPTATMHQFGKEHAGANYGAVFTAFGIAGVVGALLKQTLNDALGFHGLTLLMGGLCCGAFVLSFQIRKPKRG